VVCEPETDADVDALAVEDRLALVVIDEDSD